jgi:hypothetical protein
MSNSLLGNHPMLRILPLFGVGTAAAVVGSVVAATWSRELFFVFLWGSIATNFVPVAVTFATVPLAWASSSSRTSWWLALAAIASVQGVVAAKLVAAIYVPAFQELSEVAPCIAFVLAMAIAAYSIIGKTASWVLFQLAVVLGPALLLVQVVRLFSAGLIGAPG